MLIFLLIILLAVVIPDVIIWDWIFPSLCVGWKLLLCLPTLVVFASMWATMTGRWGHNLSIRMFFGSLLLLAFPKLVFALIAWPFGWIAGLTVAVLVLFLFAYGFMYGWLRLAVKRETLEFADLPKAFDGYRILQISDFHIGTFEHHPAFVKRVVETANSQGADLIVFTGDLINISGNETKPFVEILSRLKAKDGVLSILGNHDYADVQAVVADERRMGWRLLTNEHVNIERDNQTISVIGVEQTGRPPFAARGHLKEAMSGIPSETFKILLTHDPSHWRLEVLDKTNIQFTLSGHTHAAQLKIGRFSPARWMYREWGGKYEHDGRVLYVSLGLGGTMPFRLGAWPEINVITLKNVVN